MPAPWSLSSFPTCRYHVLLSHCAEDRDWLVAPLIERFESGWDHPLFDRHHYPGWD
jgi:hypothetical protein